MGGTTASGYPYITPTDHPKEYPAASQALANKLEAAVCGSAVRGADNAYAGGATNVVASVTVAGATNRPVMVTGELRYQNTAAGNLTMRLFNGATLLRSLLLASDPIHSGPDNQVTITVAAVAAAGESFSMDLTHNGAHTIRAGSAIHVIGS